MKARNLYAATGLAILALCVSAVSFAASKAEIDASVSTSLKKWHAINPAHKELESKAAGMLVFPRVTKGGAGIAGEYGEGVLRVHHETMGYYSLSSASLGLTLGVAKHSEIILFMTQEALDKFKNSKGWSIGADTGIDKPVIASSCLRIKSRKWFVLFEGIIAFEAEVKVFE